MSFSKLFSRFLRTFQCCSEISLLFNFQRPNEFTIVNSAVLYLGILLPSSWQPTYYTSILFKCQYFFWIFFIFFHFSCFVNKKQIGQGVYCAQLPKKTIFFNPAKTNASEFCFRTKACFCGIFPIYNIIGSICTIKF